jgi:hypothetical protein
MVRAPLIHAAARRSGYNRRVHTRVTQAALFLVLLGSFFSIETALAQSTDSKPQTRVSVVNVCALTEADALLMAASLNSVPLKPAFAADFEISRGLAAPKGALPSRWARVRRDFATGASFITAQYSIAADESGGVIETLVLAPREHRSFLQLSIEAEVTAGSPDQVLAGETPATHVRLERTGSNLVLARCPQADQSAMQPLFAGAANVLNAYRKALKVKALAAELTRTDLRPASAPAAAKSNKR